VLTLVVGIAHFWAYSQKRDFVWFNQPATQAQALCWSLMGVLEKTPDLPTSLIS
jgi:hypothetical protein